MELSIIFLKKANEDGIPTDDVLRVFNSTDDLPSIRKAVESAKERLFVSWASVDMKDKAGEKIKITDIIEEQNTLLKRGAPMTDNHSNRVIGKTVAFKVMEHPETKTFGVLHLCKVHNDNDYDDVVWGEIKSGERKGLSVGGFASEDKRIVQDLVTGEQAVELQGFKQFETASVHEPCNPLATNEAVSAVAKGEAKAPDVEIDGVKYSPVVSEFEENTQESSKGCESDEEENVKNKEDDEDNMSDDSKKSEGDFMSEETKYEERLKAMEDGQSAILKKLDELVKADLPKPEEEEEEMKKKEKKKSDEEEQVDKADEEEESKKSVDLSGDDKPEAPKPKEENQEDAFKRLEKKMEEKMKSFVEDVKKSSTPRPTPGQIDVNKAQDVKKYALDVLSGKKKADWNVINKMHREAM